MCVHVGVFVCVIFFNYVTLLYIEIYLSDAFENFLRKWKLDIHRLFVCMCICVRVVRGCVDLCVCVFRVCV